MRADSISAALQVTVCSSSLGGLDRLCLPRFAVVVWLRATGDAPILKQQKVKVRGRCWLEASGKPGARHDVCADLWGRALQVLASERFSKIVDVLRQKTKSSQLARTFPLATVCA